MQESTQAHPRGAKAKFAALLPKEEKNTGGSTTSSSTLATGGAPLKEVVQATTETISLAAVVQGPPFRLQEAHQELKQGVSRHQSAVKAKANPGAKQGVGSPASDEELERKTLGVSITSSALEVQMANNAEVATLAEPDPKEPMTAMETARRPAPGSGSKPDESQQD